MPGADLIDFETLEATPEDGNEGDLDEGDEVLLGPLEDRVQSSVVRDPGKGTFNGLITNDKFCLTRIGRLQLSWPRARGGRQETAAPQLPGEITHRGGDDAAAASMACPANRRVDADRPAAMGPGLPTPPAVGGDDVTRADTGAGVPNPAGGVPCA